MGENIFAQPVAAKGSREQPKNRTSRFVLPEYSVNKGSAADNILSFLKGCAVGFAVLFVFYKLWLLSAIGGIAVGVASIYADRKKRANTRIRKLRVEFYDMLEAMSVSMRAGNPVLKALESAKEDLELIYSKDSDIIVELTIILERFRNAMPLSAAFEDFAERSGLEDVASFASVYATIEGKSSRADEIVRETQQIIADKMAIEMEIDTLMTAAKSEVSIMLLLPLVILGVIGYAGAGFMDAIYTTPAGRLVATGGLVIFIISYIMAQRFSNVEI